MSPYWYPEGGATLKPARAVPLYAAVALLLPTAALGGSPAPALPTGSSSPATAAHQLLVPLDPTAADAYLQAQRAGAGTPQQAAQLYAQARAAAASLADHPRPLAQAAPANANFAGQTWHALGPAPVTNSYYGGDNSGRVTGLAVTGSNPVTVFLGSAGGGVWEAQLNGTSTSWAPLTDGQADLAIGTLAEDPFASGTVFAGTGEANGCGDCYPGLGILESTDGGSTWSMVNPQGTFTGQDISSIAWLSSKVVLVGTQGPGSAGNLYESTDGGQSWAPETGTGWQEGPVSSVVVNLGSSTPEAWVAVDGVGIEEATFNGTDLGSWSTVPATTIGSGITAFGPEVALAISPAPTNSNVTLYASVGSYDPSTGTGQYQGLYKSSNGGSSWSQLSVPYFTSSTYAYYGANSDSGTGPDGNPTADQSFYDNVVAVDPANPTTVVVAGITALVSTDGGSTWANLNSEPFFCAPPASSYATCQAGQNPPNSFHPDFHALAFDQGGDLFLGNDGGVWELPASDLDSVDSATGSLGSVSNSAYANLNTNLDITQFYEDLGQYGNGAQILGGAQDNGTSLSTSGTSGGPSAWTEELTGDGGYSAINPEDQNQMFGEADEALYVISQTGVTDITPNDSGANFVPPMAIVANPAQPDNPTVYYGGHYLWQTQAAKVSWRQLTSDTAATPQPVSAIAVSPSSSADVYAGYDDGTLQYSTDATSSSPTFTTLNLPAGASPGWVTHIDVDPSNPADILVSESAGTGIGNTQTTFTTPVVLYITGANSSSPTVTDVTGNLPTGASANSVVFDNGVYLAATDVGVFEATSLDGASTSWLPLGAGLPHVQVIGLTVTPNGTVLAATHGRGVWALTPTQSAADGSGALSVAPSSVVSGSTGNTLEFVYTAATGGTEAGDLQLSIPSGWSPPQATSPAGAGYVSLASCTGATVSASASVVSIGNLSLPGGQSCSFDYANATAPTSAGTSTFSAEEASTPSGTLTPLVTSPQVQVTSPPTTTTASSTTSTTTAGGGGPLGGGVPGGATPTTTVLMATPNPVTVGQPVTFTATVTPGPGAGTVQFTDNGLPIAACSALPFITSTSAVTCRLSYDAPGLHDVVATYSGDSFFSGSSSNSFGEVVEAATSATTTTTAKAPTTTVATGATGAKPLPVPTWARTVYAAPKTTTLGPSGGCAGFSTRKLKVTVCVPKGALPPGTTVLMAPVRNTGPLSRKLPAGQSYLLSFALSWAAPNGSSPKSAKPLAITVTAPGAHPGDTAYELTPKGLKAVGRLRVAGKLALRSRSPVDLLVANVPRLVGPQPQVALHGAQVLVTLRCGPAVACRGTATLALPRPGGLVLARASFLIGASLAKVVALYPSAAGHKLLSQHRRLTARLTAQLTGGSTTTYLAQLP